MLLGFVFLCTGCHADYYLTIQNNQFLEKIEIIANNRDESNILLEDKIPITAFYNAPDTGEEIKKIEGVEYLEKSTYQNSSGLTNMVLSYPYQFNNYALASSVHYCYQSLYFDVSDVSKNVYLHTSSENLCFEKYPYLESVNIIVEVFYPVISSNADEINKNQYIWHIDKNNYREKEIKLSYNSNTLIDEKKQVENEEEKSFSVILIVFSFFILFLLGIFIYNYKQRNHS